MERLDACAFEHDLLSRGAKLSGSMPELATTEIENANGFRPNRIAGNIEVACQYRMPTTLGGTALKKSTDENREPIIHAA
jgi:hypothetical protein